MSAYEASKALRQLGLQCGCMWQVEWTFEMIARLATPEQREKAIVAVSSIIQLWWDTGSESCPSNVELQTRLEAYFQSVGLLTVDYLRS